MLPTHATGVGEITGTKYHGGGFNKGVTITKWKFAYLDTTDLGDHGIPDIVIDSVFVNTFGLGKETERIKYKSDHGEVTQRVRNVYKQVNGITVLDIGNGAPAALSCKEY